MGRGAGTPRPMEACTVLTGGSDGGHNGSDGNLMISYNPEGEQLGSQVCSQGVTSVFTRGHKGHKGHKGSQE
eukprot:7088364-Prymnesium_polylepis.1